jgi:hypothetical protein
MDGKLLVKVVMDDTSSMLCYPPKRSFLLIYSDGSTYTTYTRMNAIPKEWVGKIVAESQIHQKK